MAWIVTIAELEDIDTRVYVGYIPRLTYAIGN